MDKRIGAKDFSGRDGAPRTALGDDDVSIVKACAAVTANATKALDMLDAVPTEGPPGIWATRLWPHSLDGPSRPVLPMQPV